MDYIYTLSLQKEESISYWMSGVRGYWKMEDKEINFQRIFTLEGGRISYVLIIYSGHFCLRRKLVFTTIALARYLLSWRFFCRWIKADWLHLLITIPNLTLREPSSLWIIPLQHLQSNGYLPRNEGEKYFLYVYSIFQFVFPWTLLIWCDVFLGKLFDALLAQSIK